MDRAWFLLMLHSGLRTAEVRRLTLADIDWERRLIRIEQSKGLKDRLVPFSPPTADALRTYLDVRGPAAALPETVFIYRHVPMGRVYCFHRLIRYGQRCGVQISPHRLRHSCATLLLNAGAPILTVQAILGHTHIDTTLDYARLYDGVVAADYYRAMSQVEGQFKVSEDAAAEPPTHGELLALVDSLRSGTLNDTQTETVCLLRARLAMLAERAAIGSPPV
jgi:integrase